LHTDEEGNTACVSPFELDNYMRMQVNTYALPVRIVYSLVNKKIAAFS